MRFIFVDRIVAVEAGRHIETLKNVSATEDVFADHFPGCPILPGTLIVEAFGQAAELLIAMTHDFTRVGRLTRLSGVAFRRFVRPGDRLRLRCERREAPAGFMVTATAEVEGDRVATGTLEYALEEVAPGTEAEARAEGLRALARELEAAPLDLARRKLAG